jgi:hypothetical protein
MPDDTLGSVLPRKAAVASSDASPDAQVGELPAARRVEFAQSSRRFWVHHLIFRSLLLDRIAYVTLLEGAYPLLRGLLSLFLVCAVVATSRVGTLWFNVLTTPQLDILRSRAFDLLAHTPWYQGNIAVDSQLAANIEYNYNTIWAWMMFFVGRPPQEDMVSALLLAFLGTVALCLLAWLMHGMIAHGMARWQGGRAHFSSVLGSLALGFSPLLINIFAVLPGLRIPLSLMIPWLLCSQFQAVSVTYGLSWSRSLATVVAPYLFWGFMIASALLLFIGVQLSHLPDLNGVIDALRGG